MDQKILILTGDNLGLKNEQIDYPDVAVVKFPVVIDEKEYFEDETHTAQYLIERFKKEKIVARSQALLRKDIVEVIEKNKDKYDLIVHVLMGSNMSSATVQMAEGIRKDYEGIIPIINIDTKQAPMELPATHRLLAVARKLPGNQRVTARSWAGNATGSASPSIPRQKASCPKVRVSPVPRHALDHASRPASIMLPAPHRSTSQPASGYMPA